MRQRNLAVFPRLALLAVVTACSGGGSDSTPPGASSCGSADVLCLTSCNLGCTSDGGCTITDIAPNQPLIFNFSQNIDPASVDGASFSLRTLAGEEPVGQLFVERGTISFIPEVRSLQGATFFGFTANETYVLTLPGGPSAATAIASTAGDRLDRTLSCTFRISRPVVDLDQRAPEGRLLTPSTTSNVSRATSIVIEFSELIDFGPFFNAAPEDQPIQYRVRRSFEPDPVNEPGVLRCDTTSRTVRLNGAPRLANDTIAGVTRVSFTPVESLPPGSCVEAEVTSRVRDLAGTRAQTTVFRFTLEASAASESSLDFEFDNDLALDRERSSTVWANGTASFVALGGDGRHGDFVLNDGTASGLNTFVFDTDASALTRKDTSFLNQASTVTDGRYYFTRFVLPETTTLIFRGSKPARIYVRGECRIDGRILLDGVTVQIGHNGNNAIPASGGNPVRPGPGQRGSTPGAGGGRGGDGAWGCDGTGNPNQPNFNNFAGYDGEDLRLPTDGGYVHPLTAQAVGTGGRGAPLFPPHGNQTLLRYGGFGGQYGYEAAGGAGGGGFVIAGTAGLTREAGWLQGEPPNTDPSFIGPSASGGGAIPLTANPGSPSSLYYLIGGSGGGGGASHALFAQVSNAVDPVKYHSGAAGAGGGGAILLRAGAEIRIGEAGRISAAGGSCDPTTTSFSVLTNGALSPGGGGSGGSIVLQSATRIDQRGSLSVAGGNGSRTDVNGFFNLDLSGGNGSPGFIRAEVAGTAPTIAELGNVTPPLGADNLGVLDPAADGDQLVGFQTRFVGTNEAFPPVYLRYEIVAEFRGPSGTRTVTFSDDPNLAPGVIEAVEGQALRFYVQGIDVDPGTGEPVSGAVPGPWRRLVGDFRLVNGEAGLNSDATTGLRWALLRDRSIEPDTEVVIQSLRIIFRS